MKPMNRIFVMFLSFGLVAAGIFPFYANIFVNWKPGMLKYFILGCVVAGVFVGTGNFFVFRAILHRLGAVITDAAAMNTKEKHFRREPADDLYNSFVNKFIALFGELLDHQHAVETLGYNLAKEVEDIRAVISATTAIADDLRTKTRRAADSAAAGEKDINALFSSCKDINNHLESSLEKMRLFEVKYSDINSATQTIAGLSQQTDLLATNASITAARAGDLGREFAVVAGEVKKLASRSHTVTNEIVDSVSTTRREAQSAIKAIADAASESSRYADRFRTASSQLAEINRTSLLTMTALEKVSERLTLLTGLSDEIEKSARIFLDATGG